MTKNAKNLFLTITSAPYYMNNNKDNIRTIIFGQVFRAVFSGFFLSNMKL